MWLSRKVLLHRKCLLFVSRRDMEKKMFTRLRKWGNVILIIMHTCIHSYIHTYIHIIYCVANNRSVWTPVVCNFNWKYEVLIASAKYGVLIMLWPLVETNTHFIASLFMDANCKTQLAHTSHMCNTFVTTATIPLNSIRSHTTPLVLFESTQRNALEFVLFTLEQKPTHIFFSWCLGLMWYISVLASCYIRGLLQSQCSDDCA